MPQQKQLLTIFLTISYHIYENSHKTQQLTVMPMKVKINQPFYEALNEINVSTCISA